MTDPTLQAVLFDLDDTLHDRTAAGRLRAERWVDQHLTPDGPTERAQMVAWLIALDDGGYGSKAEILRRLQERRPALAWDVETFTRLFVEALIEHITLTEEAQSLLEALQTDQIPWGIVTNGPATQRDKIVHLGLDKLTDCVLVSSEFGCRKPDRRIFDAAADRLGVPATQILFVGDHCRNDIVGAHGAGMATAWLAHGRPWPQEEAAAPDHIVSSLADVWPILNPASIA